MLDGTNSHAQAIFSHQALLLADEEINRLQYALSEGIIEVTIRSRSGDELLIPVGTKTGRKIAGRLHDKLEMRRRALWLRFLKDCETDGLDASIIYKQYTDEHLRWIDVQRKNSIA